MDGALHPRTGVGQVEGPGPPLVGVLAALDLDHYGGHVLLRALHSASLVGEDRVGVVVVRLELGVVRCLPACLVVLRYGHVEHFRENVVGQFGLVEEEVRQYLVLLADHGDDVRQ
ncbi:hypothetical protein GEV43_20765 [Actinomadura sp. J1-007]|uniref:hypothetical protein n=1 Tax=Actinomadura sp. J1-007 TaxID=2661913 RepID=UPI00132A5BD1|nr:hypothetical protein [Actinomadura sp. J1-007]MWK36233.1 hypothetical protein [Actinomadura sp. J1-007]